MSNTNLTTINPEVPSSEYIFNRLFFVQTRQEALQTESATKTFGTRSTGINKYDNQLFGQYTQCYIPIARMASIFDKGYEVNLVNHEDAKTVYEFIQYHLETWMKFMSSGVNEVPAPFDDLRLLDRFAASVYGVAVHQYDKADHLTTFGRFLSQFKDLSEDAFSIDKLAEEAKAAEPKARPSMQDALIEHQSRLYR